jgi:AmpD protein
MIDSRGICQGALFIDSPNHDERPDVPITLVVIHNISLPPGEYGGNGIIELFTNRLNPEAHPYFAEIHQLQVSSHFLIRRDGSLIQFVSCLQRAWHAGQSIWQGRERCNDFSVGVELEGSDHEAFTDMQYTQLKQLLDALKAAYPIAAVAGHSDIAPGRKTDPGPYFDWSRISNH